MAISEREKILITKFIELLKDGAKLATAKQVTGIYLAKHKGHLSDDAQFLIREITEQHRIRKHLIPSGAVN